MPVMPGICLNGVIRPVTPGVCLFSPLVSKDPSFWKASGSSMVSALLILSG